MARRPSLVRSTFTNNAELNALRNVSFAVATTYVSLHAGNPGITGANEVTGGSYARQLVTLSAAAASATSSSGALNFTSMPVVAAPGLTHLGLWSAVSGGNFLWAGPLGPRDVRVFNALASTDVFTAVGSSYTTSDMVDMVQLFDSLLPVGCTALTNYFIVTPSGNTWKIALTSGGTAINITTDGGGLVRRIQPRTVNAGETVSVPIGNLALVEV